MLFDYFFSVAWLRVSISARKDGMAVVLKAKGDTADLVISIAGAMKLNPKFAAVVKQAVAMYESGDIELEN